MAETTQTPGGTPQTHTLSASGADVLTLPEGLSVSEAEFAVDGSDLVLTFPDGSKVTVENYYEQAQPPQLASADGANLSGDMVVQLTGTPDSTNSSTIQQFADAASGSQVIGGTDGAPIGTVKTLSGEVWVTRADGTRVQLQAGDQVYQGDSIETGPKGAIGVLLADETTFSMGEASSMVLDEMVYDPATQNGSLNVSVVQGVFTFVSGQVAKTDPDAMKIDTPVATIGIRGTQVGIEIPPAGEGDMQVVLMQEADGFVGEVVIENNSGQVVMNQGGDFVSIPSYDSQASQRGHMSDDDIVERHATTLKHLPVESTDGERTSGNHFGLQEDIEQGTNQEQGQQDDQPSAEELANTETAAGGNQDETQQPTPEVDAQPELTDQPSAEDLNNLDTQAGGQQGFQEDFTDVTTEIDPFAPNTQDTGVGENTPPANNTTPGTSTGTSSNNSSETEQVFVGDGASVNAGAGSGSEDGAISLPLTVNKVDANDTLSVTLTGIPEGSVLRSNGAEIQVTGGTAILTEAQISGLNITPPENYSGSFNIGVSATTIEGGVISNATTGTISVDVTGVADAPTLTMSVGDEVSGAVPLNITATTPDTDGSETVSVTISDIPVGATLNLGGGLTFTATDGNTSITLTPEQLSGLTIVPVGEDEFTLSVTATTTETDGDSVTLAPQSLVVDPANLADGATLVLGDVSGNEDTAIALPVTIDKADDSETAEITLSGIPQGATLSNANGPITVNEDGTVVLSEADLEGLQITPPANSDADMSIGVSVVTIDGDSTSEPTTGTITVGVDGVADVPTLSVDSSLSGVEDGGPIALDISSALTDTDGSETLSVTISDIPPGATITLANGISFTASEGNTSVDLSPSQLQGLTVTPAADSGVDFALTVTATSTEADGDTATQTATIDVAVASQADAPTVTVDAASGLEDGGPIALNIDPQAAAEDINGEVVSVTITGVPEGATLSAGTFNADTGEWTVDAADVDGLTVSLPEDFDTDFSLQVSATAQETDPETGAVTTATSTPVALDVSVVAQVDAPTVGATAASGAEDTAIPLNIDPQAAAEDINGEVTGVTISGIPVGATLNLPGGLSFTATDANSSVTLTPAQLEGLTITPLADSADDFQLTVTATATETDPDTGEVTTATSDPVTLDVTVQGVADGAQVGDTVATGTEDTAIPFTVDVSELDTDGSETLSVTLSNIPEGAVITRNGEVLEIVDGQVTLSEGELEGLAILPPADFSGNLDLTVSATTTDEGDVSETALGSISIDVSGVADGAALNFDTAAGDEDTAIALPISIDKADDSETAEITLSGIPEGAVLANANGPIIVNEDGTVVLSEADLEGLQITPPANSDADMPIGVSVVTMDGDSTSEPTTGTITVGVDGVADVPALEVGSAVEGTGFRGDAIPLDIASALTDTDGSETLSVSISGVPAGATLSAGTYDAETDTWTLTPQELEGLSVSVADDYDTDFQLTVAATSTEADGDTATQTATIDVDVNRDVLTGGGDTFQMDDDAVVYAGEGDDTITGTDGDDAIFGEAGNDILIGGAGSDLLDGGDGIDTVDFSALDPDSPLYIDLGEGEATVGDDLDTLVSIENVIGGAGDDIIVGSDGDNVLAGGLGDDTFTGGGGDDTIIGGDGTDTAVFEDNFEEFTVNLDSDSGELSVGGSDLDGNDTLIDVEVLQFGDLTITVEDLLNAAMPDLDVSAVDTSTVEDVPVALPISASLADGVADGTETLSVTLSGIPEGAVLSVDGVPLDVVDGAITFSDGVVPEGLAILPPPNSAEDMQITVSATSQSVATVDGVAQTTTSEQVLNVTVAPDAEAPVVTAAGADALTFNEDAGAIDVGALFGAVTVEPGEEIASFTIGGLPEGVTLSGPFTENTDGTFTIEAADLGDVKLNLPEDFDENFTLQVSATASQTDPETGAVDYETSAPIDVPLNIIAQADAPTVTVDAASGLEDGGPIALNIDPQAAAEDINGEVVSVTITGVPEGAALSAGTFNAETGEWTVAAADVEGLTVSLPEDFDTDFSLQVSATAQETDPDTGEITTATSTPVALDVSVVAQVDAPTVDVEAASGNEDTAIALDIDPAVAGQDLQGEVTSVTISGIPVGATLNLPGGLTFTATDANSTVSLTPAQLEGLTITPLADSADDFQLTVTATATETDPDTGEVTTATSDPVALDVTVQGVADGAQVTDTAASGTEDTAIPFTVDVSELDTDGSETLSVTLSNIPEGAVITRNGEALEIVNGQVTLAEGELDGLAITPPADFSGDLDLTVSATTTDEGDVSEAALGTVSIDVSGVADAPELDLNDATGNEDTAIPLDISATLPDGSEALSLSISGIPDNATLTITNSGGQQVPVNVVDGVAEIPAGLIGGQIYITPPTDSADDFQLSVTATSRDGDSTATSTGTLDVTVQGVADGAQVTDTAASGVEDTAIPFSVDVSELDTDGSESLSVTLSNIPEGAVILRNGEPVAVNEDGTVTLAEGELDGLAVLPPADFSGAFDIAVSATTTDEGDVSEAALGSISVDVAGQADGAALNVADISGDEDTGIALPITIDKADDSETAEITLSGIPEGAILSNASGPISVVDGIAVLTEADLAGLQITPPADSDADFNVGVSVVTTDGVSVSDPATGTISVGVDGVADVPALTVDSAVSGAEDGGPIALDIASSLTDVDGSESLSITISGVPADATLSAGTKNEDGTWTLSSGDLDGLSVTPGADSGEDFQLTVTATSTEADGGDTAVQTATIDVSVASQADAPTMTVDAASGLEDGAAIPLNIDAAAAAEDVQGEVTGFTISDIPVGAVLNLGGGFQFTATEGNTSVNLTPAMVENLSIDLPEDFDENFSLQVSATAQERDPDTGAITTATSTPVPLNVEVVAQADAPTVATQDASGVEDGGPIALNIDADAAAEDINGEVVSVTIAGVPEGATLSAGTFNADTGEWTVAAADVEGLTVSLPEDFDTDFSLQVSATAQETDPETGAVTTATSAPVALDVSVAAQVDAPTVTVDAASGIEDGGAIPLNIDAEAAASDINGEVVSVTVSDIPVGATLNLGGGFQFTATEGNTSVSLTPEMVEGLSISLPEDFDEDFSLTVTATAEEIDPETGETSSATSAPVSLAVAVDAVADAPTVDVSNASGTEDGGPIALDIDPAAAAEDINGEVVSVTISGVPEGATLSAGSFNAETGEWTVDAADVDGLTVSLPEDFDTDFTLQVSATAQETDPETGTVTTVTSTPVALGVSVASQVDAPTVTVDAAAGDEDTAIALNIDADAAAQDINGEVTGVTISGIPAGATLTLPGGLTFTASETSNSVTLTPAQLEGLTITPLADSSDDFQLTITATATETDPETGAVTTATSAPATLDVTVQGIADGAQVTDTTASGAEDTAIPLTIDVTELDTDGSETLSVTLSNIPEGAVLTRNGEPLEIVNGSVTLGEGELDGLEITPPADFAGNFDITVSATTTDEGDMSETATGTISVDVSGGADGATVTLGAAQGDEDTAIALPITIDKADESETAQITLSGIPQGAVLSNANGPINVTDGVAVLSEADLAGLQIKAPADSGADFQLDVSVVTTDGDSTSEPATGTINVGVDAVADVPSLTVGSVTGGEDTAIPLNIAAGLTDTDGSEVLSVTISDVPPGAVLTLADGSSFTATPENTTFLFAGDQLDGLTITPPENSDEDFSLNVVATSLDTDPDTGAVTTSSVEGAMTVSVDPEADAPTLVLDNAAGDEDAAIALNIDAGLTDASEVLSVTISDIPEGATLTLANGTEFTASEGNTSYDIDPSDLAGLTITPPDDSNEDFNLTVTATSTESDGSTSTTSSALNVNVTGVADLPTLSVTLGEGTPGTTGGGEGAGFVIDTSGAIDVTGSNEQTHHGTTGNDTFLVDRNLNQNENFNMKTGGDIVVVNGNTAGGTNFNMGEGNDMVVINGDIGGNTNVNGSGQEDVLILGKSSDHYQFQNYTESASGLINTQIIDLDTGQTLTVNNIETIAFGDGEYRGNADLLPNYNSGGESVVTYPLDITSELQDIDGSETLSITVSGLPEGAVLSAGEQNEDGSWTLDPSDLADLTLTVPSTAESFGLSVTATSTEDDGDTASVSTSVGVTVDDTASDPSLNLTDAAGTEDQPIPLDISAALTDTDGSESLSITLSGIPDGAVLKSGDTVLVVENGEITFEDGVVPDNLTIQAPDNSDEDFALTVSATSTESSTGDQSTVTSTLNVAVTGDADAPTLTVDLGAGVPAGGSEEVPGSVTITNAAQGQAGYHNTYGYYVIGEDGAPQSGQIIWADVKDSVGDTFTLDGVDPEDIGFFIIPNGDDLNNNLSDGMNVTFTQGQDGNWHVVGPNGQVLSGQGDPVLFDDPTLNEGNFDYTQDTNQPGNQNWEDLAGGGDNDFNDININVETVATQPGTGGPEFVEYPLNINAALVDIDGSESLSATLSGMPAGAVVTLADGTEFTITSPTSGIELTSTQLQGITLTVPAGSEDFDLQVTATATEADGDTATVSTSVGVDVPVFDSEASDPSLTVSDAAGVEDGTIPLDIAAALTDTDGSESLSITLSGIPDGAVLKSGDTVLAVENGEITFADGVVPENLTIQPPTNSGADFDITVSATSTEEAGGDTSTTTGTINVAVAAIADTVALDVSDATFDEGATTVPLDISAQLGDLDGSEDLTVTISGVPEGVTLSGGQNNGDGSWTLSGDDLQDLTMTLPSGESTTSTLYSQNFNSLSDGTIAAGGDNGFTSTGGYSGNDDRTAVDNDRFEFQNPTGGDISTWSSAAIDISGQEDVSFSFNMKGYGDMETSGHAADYFKVIAVVDGVEHELMTHNGELDNWSTITLDDIPQGDSLVIKMEVRTTGGDEVYKMDNLSVEGTTTTAAAPVEDFNLEITATAADTDPDTGAVSYSSTEANLLVTVAAEDDASAPTVTVSDAAGSEDTPIALDITAFLTDLDGSEEISSITLSGIPAGATLNHGTLDEATGDWSVELSDLVDLEVTPAPNSNDDFQITVSVTSTESNGGATATTTATLDVDVTGVVDDFTVAANDAAGQSGTELPLDISVGLTDLDGSETVSVTLTGIPEGATLNHGTFDEGTGNWTLSGDDLDGLTISLPETVEGEGGGEPQTLYSQNFDNLSYGATSAGGDNGFSTDASQADAQNHGVGYGGYVFSKSDTDAYDNDDGVMQWNSAPIDISGQDDVSFSFKLGSYGDLESEGVYADFFQVIAVVDGVEHELMVESGDVCSHTFTLDNIPEGDELVIRMVSKTNMTDEAYKIDNLVVEGTPAAAEPLESFQIGVETTVTESDGASETVSTTLNVDINNDAEAEAPTLTVTEQAPTTEDVAVALNIAAALTDTDGSETLSVTLSGIPDGAVLKSGDTVLTVENGEITFADGVVPDNLSLTPPANSDADIELTVSATSTEANGGATTTSTSTIDIDVSALADVPTITSVTIGAPTVTEGTEGVAETVTISTANFGENDAGFSIAGRTINSNGTLSEASTDNVSTNGSPLGFGVAGNASGDSNEIGYSNYHDVSEELIVTFDDDVSSADVSFAWLASSEQASYKLFRDGVEVGSGTVNGVTDGIDDPVTLSADGGFDQIVFSAPSGGDDYLINSISFETQGGTPDVAEYPIDIVAGLADADGSENLSVTIGGVPEGASLSAGTDNGDGTWTVSGGDLEGLSLSVPFEDEVEAFDLSFTATATEQSNNSMATSAAVVVAAAAVVAPEPEPEPVPVEEDFDGLDMDGEDNNNDEMVGGDTSSDDWTGNYQAQTFAGSTKNDDLNTGGGGDTLYGGAGNDELTGSWGNDTFFGGSGNDDLSGGDGNDQLFGGSGNDDILGGTGNDEIQGGSGNDEIEGNDGDDLLYGGAGNDEIEGGTGHDTIYGGSGDDEIEGNDGQDVLYGGSGNDDIEGGSGHDTIYGGSGNDEIEGGDGEDVLYGGSGNDEIEGGSGHDTVHGGSGDDEIKGNDGEDVLYGGSGNDEIEGGSGHDQLFGGLGDDYLEGGSGNDILFGGAGNDVLNGGSGQDTFIFDADSGHDIIEDIMLQDTLEFQGEQFDMNDMIFSENEEGDAVISFAGNNDMSVTLEGVKYSDLDTNGDGNASEGYSVTQTDDGFTVNIDDT
ncbi:FecR domain-containing protein [Thalassospiraceae bacterium LMO-SO8]|nr:FecR domain-containing protein [Alphaproteobacteria bacterium LMO-S08]WND75984.1 FecR domain-containing protein [Thalassospiraceae bacterium LMO-SO8]